MKLIFVILVTVFFVSCSNSENYYNLSKDEIKTIKKTNNWFSYFKHTHEVQLENREDGIPIMKLVAVIFNKQYIVGVTDYVNGFVYVWHHNGQLIGRVGGKGKGPGEYMGVNHIFFDSDTRIGIVDGGLAKIHLFNIHEKDIQFDDSIDTGVLFNDTPTRVYVRDDKRILFFSTGFNTPSVVVMNKSWEKINEFHFIQKETVGAYSNAIADDEYIYLTDGRDGYNFISHSGYVYKYSFDGVLQKRIDTNDAEFSTVPLQSDAKKKILLIHHQMYTTVYDMKWNKIHKFKFKPYVLPKEFNHKPSLSLQAGDMYEFFITGELPKDKNKSLILHFFERSIPE